VTASTTETVRARATRWLGLLRLEGTPGRLRALAALLVVATLVFAIVAATATSSRRRAAQSAATETEPRLVAAESLYAAMADADATATTTFLTGGLEPPKRRRRYAGDIQTASRELATLARRSSGSASALSAVQTLLSGLPVYAGTVEAARANNRQGFPVGAAYLRHASSQMRGQLLPAASELYDAESGHLADDYRTGKSSATLVAAIAVTLLLLAMLVGAQLFLARVTHRRVSVPIAIAATVVLVLGIWIAVGLSSEGNNLNRAQRTGSDSVRVLSAARVLLLRAQDDEGLALAERGGNETRLADFQAVAARLGAPSRPSTLMGAATTITREASSNDAAKRLAEHFERYTAVHRRVVGLETNGRFTQAVNLAVGVKQQEVPLADELNTELSTEIAGAQNRFTRSSADATSAVTGLWLAIPVLGVLIAALALLGTLERLREYR
jgi:hypothetical protein